MNDDPTLTLDWATGEPVYEQIARQIRTRIAAGDLPPGHALPPVRTLASDLGVNLNTVARAYRQLEEQGFVLIRDRSGAEVAAPAAPLIPTRSSGCGTSCATSCSACARRASRPMRSRGGGGVDRGADGRAPAAERSLQ